MSRSEKRSLTQVTQRERWVTWSAKVGSMIRHAKPVISLTLCVALSLLVGCGSAAAKTVRFGETTTYPPTFPDLVQVLRAEPARPHVRLGEVYVEPEGDASVEAIEAGLQKGAAPLGADAVVIVADRTLKMGALVEASWVKRDVLPTPDRVVVGVAIRYLQ